MTTPAKDDLPPRDPRFDALWRAASDEAPPAALDAAILAAARREVGAGPQSLSARAALQARRRWWPLAAAATVAAIAVGVAQLVTHEELGAPSADNTIVSDIPAQASKVAPSAAAPPSEAAPAPSATPAPPLATKSAPREEKRATGAGAAAEGRARSSAPIAAAPLQKKTESAPATAAALPEPFPAASPKLSAATAPEAPPPPVPAFAVAPGAPRMDAVQPSPVAKTAMAESQKEAGGRINDRAPLPIPDWIALIRRLRDEGNTTDAVRELAAFRTAHADHEKLLPPDLRNWQPPGK